MGWLLSHERNYKLINLAEMMPDQSGSTKSPFGIAQIFPLQNKNKWDTENV